MYFICLSTLNKLTVHSYRFKNVDNYCYTGFIQLCRAVALIKTNLQHEMLTAFARPHGKHIIIASRVLLFSLHVFVSTFFIHYYLPRSNPVHAETLR